MLKKEKSDVVLNALSRHDLQRIRAAQALHQERNAPKHWQLDDLRRWPVAKIFQRLRALGISTGKAQFLDAAESVISVREIFAEWIQDVDMRTVTASDLEFIFLIIKVLWEKFAPELSYVEQLHDRIAEGYQFLSKDFEIVRWRRWCADWAALYELLPTEINELPKLEDIIGGGAFWSNWLEMLEQDWRARLADGDASPADYSAWLAEAEKQFADLPLKHPFFQRARIHAAFALGQPDTAQALLEEFNATFENSVDGYFELSECYSGSYPYAATAADPVQALHYYNRVLDSLTAHEPAESEPEAPLVEPEPEQASRESAPNTDSETL